MPARSAPPWVRYPLQALNYAIFMALVWYFSAAPPVRPLEPGEAVATIAFGHAGALKSPCRELSPEELAALPANMRKPTDCPRERSSVRVQALMDGQTLFDRTVAAPGLYQDGSADIFLSSRVPAGDHLFALGINDDSRVEGFTHRQEQTLTLAPGQRLVIRYTTQEGFTFH